MTDILLDNAAAPAQDHKADSLTAASTDLPTANYKAGMLVTREARGHGDPNATFVCHLREKGNGSYGHYGPTEEIAKANTRRFLKDMGVEEIDCPGCGGNVAVDKDCCAACEVVYSPQEASVNRGLEVKA